MDEDLARGYTSEVAQHGERLFKEAGCEQCHPAPLYTDLCRHDVGTGKDPYPERAFDTPSLVEAWRTAPYLHDGRAATMAEVLTTHNPGDRHGRTSPLSPDEIADLTLYILTR